MHVKKRLQVIFILVMINSIPLFAGEYYYHLHDHLGSVRVVVDKDANVVEAFDYYPFGAELRSTVNDNQAANLRFTGKELDKESHIGLYYFGARYYDAEVGRFVGVDPLADEYPSWSPYVYVKNNPLSYFDPNGTSTYTDSSGTVTRVTDDGHKSIFRENANGLFEYMGETIHAYSFCINGDPEKGVAGYIDFGSFEARNFMSESFKDLAASQGLAIIAIEGLVRYMAQAGYGYDRGNIYDFKTMKGYAVDDQYRGSQLIEDVYLSARDAGNYFAGAVARLYGIPKELSMRTLGAFNLAGNQQWKIPYYMMNNPGPPHYGELPQSSILQRMGYDFKYLK